MTDQHSAAAAAILAAKAARDAETEAQKTPEQRVADELRLQLSSKEQAFQAALQHVSQHLPGVEFGQPGSSSRDEGVIGRSVRIDGRPMHSIQVSWAEGPFIISVHRYTDRGLNYVSEYEKAVSWPLQPQDALISALLEAVAAVYRI